MTDHEYLLKLVNSFEISVFGEMFLHELFSGARDNENILAGLVSDTQKIESEAAKARWREHPRLYLVEDPLLLSIRKQALSCLSNYHQLEFIPVGLKPDNSLNGCAVKTPNNGAVILCNFGLFFSIAGVVRSVLAIDCDPSGPIKLLKYHNQIDYIEGLLTLAEMCATGDISLMGKSECLMGPVESFYSAEIEYGASSVNTFVMLHEYGHVHCGHLDHKDTKTVRINEQHSHLIYNNSKSNEFEADQFAFKAMKESASFDDPDLAVLAAGTLLNFLGLVEAIQKRREIYVESDTHPPALVRWKKLKDVNGLDSIPICGGIDRFWALIFCFAEKM